MLGDRTGSFKHTCLVFKWAADRSQYHHVVIMEACLSDWKKQGNQNVVQFLWLAILRVKQYEYTWLDFWANCSSSIALILKCSHSVCFLVTSHRLLQRRTQQTTTTTNSEYHLLGYFCSYLQQSTGGSDFKKARHRAGFSLRKFISISTDLLDFLNYPITEIKNTINRVLGEKLNAYNYTLIILPELQKILKKCTYVYMNQFSLLQS